MSANEWQNCYCERKHFTDNISAGSTPGFSDIEKFKLILNWEI